MAYPANESTDTLKRYFAHLFANSKDIMNLFSITEGKVILLNRAAEEATGYNLEELQRTPVDALYPVEEHAKLMAAFLELQTSGHSSDKLRMYMRNGELRDIWTRSYVVQREPEAICIVHTLDITEENRERERELRNAKLATLGQSSATLAHELKNALQSMQFSLGTLRMQLQKAGIEHTQGSLGRIERAVAHMDDVIAGVERSAHTSLTGGSYISVVSAVQNALVLMQGYLTAKRVELVTEFGKGLPLVWCDRTQLEQILVVLIKNAAQALAARERRLLRISIQLADQGVNVEVEDTAGGIAPEVEARIFKAFATTKPVGLGLGLGLAHAKQLASNNGVDLTFVTQAGVGTTFSLAFGSAVGPSEEHASGLLAERVVLLVGDELAMLSHAASMLSEAGARVLVASSAGEGLQLLRVHAIDAVVCDDAIYPMGGAAFVLEARAMYRGPLCLVVNPTELGPSEPMEGVDSVLAKPLEARALVVTLHQLLDRQLSL